jgi:Family of unknown function (DUF6390)
MTDVRLPVGPGEVIFAKYAYPPNELGYCGEGDGQEWLAVASGETLGGAASSGRPLADRARSFDGAWPYLTFLAATAGVSNPLDPLVTQAYWVGNELLESVDPVQFETQARRWFGGQAGADWACLAGGPPAAVPHHSFHVFAIYPWMGLLRRTGSGRALEVLDQCRIRWGTVLAVEGDSVSVRRRPLTWDGATLALGPRRVESARWAADGRSLLRAVHPGDVVSLHWGWVCDVLNPAQLAALRTYTDRQLTLTNRATAR